MAFQPSLFVFATLPPWEGLVVCATASGRHGSSCPAGSTCPCRERSLTPSRGIGWRTGSSGFALRSAWQASRSRCCWPITTPSAIPTPSHITPAPALAIAGLRLRYDWAKGGAHAEGNRERAGLLADGRWAAISAARMDMARSFARSRFSARASSALVPSGPSHDSALHRRTSPVLSALWSSRSHRAACSLLAKAVSSADARRRCQNRQTNPAIPRGRACGGLVTRSLAVALAVGSA